MGGSSIAAAEAAQQASRQARRFEHELARRRALRKGTRSQTHPDQDDRLPFACALRCLGCGRLSVAPSDGDPLRTDPTAWRERPCTGCGAFAWADLALRPVAESLRELESRERALRDSLWVHVAGAIALLGLCLYAFVGLFFSPAMGPVLLAIAAGAFGGCAYFVRQAAAARATPPRLAFRWLAPARSHRVGARIGGGLVHGTATETAPLSGRTVLAWRVEARYPSDRGEEAALVEQRCGAIVIDGTPLGREPTIATTALAIDELDDQARRYLASRGLDPNDLIYLVERVVHEGDAVALHDDEAGGPAILCNAPRALAATG